jgi:hypothetical protein
LKRSAIITAILTTLLGCSRPLAPPDSAGQPAQVSQSNAGATMSHPELEFFNRLSGKLEIELTAPPEKIGNLDNLRAPPEAKIKSLKLAPHVFDRETETARKLTPEELQSVAFQAAQIKLRGEGAGAVAHQAPNGQFFTVQDLLNAGAETERQTRDNSDWLDGVDVHHVYFEGIHPGEDGVWEKYWGS